MTRRLVPNYVHRPESNEVFQAMTRSDDKSSPKRQIDENLRRVYQEALDEAVPDRFKELLAKLKEQDKPK
jgi:hypothetical protein